MTAVIPVTGGTYHPRTPTPLTNLIHLQLGETTHREKPLSHDLLAKLVRHITFGKPRRAESATSDRHSRVRQSPFPSHAPFPLPLPRTGAPQSPSPTVPAPLPSSRALFSLSLSLSLSLFRSLHSPVPGPPLTPTWFFLLSSEERASPPKRKEKQQRSHAPRSTARGRGRDGGPCHKRSLFLDGTKHHSAADLFPPRITKGHEATAGHSCYSSFPRRRLPVSLLFLQPAHAAATPCSFCTSGRARETLIYVKTAARRRDLSRATSNGLSLFLSLCPA